jgi:UDP-N-acetylglucosamine acyltransferase
MCAIKWFSIRDMSIHSTAIVSESAVIGEGSSIGPFALIEDGVIIGKSCQIAGHSILRKGVVLGDSVTVDSFAVIGGAPQSIGFDHSIESGVTVGNGSILREGVTVHRSTTAGENTVIGENCFLMTQAHVAHNCKLANAVVLANNVMIAGHVTIGEKCFVGGGAGIHQFCRIGAYAMVAGNASVTADVPPYVMTADRSVAHGLNLVGLRRSNFDKRDITDLKRCYRAVYFGGGNLKRKAAEAAREHEFGTTATGARFLSFFEAGKRGFVQSSSESTD